MTILGFVIQAECDKKVKYYTVDTEREVDCWTPSIKKAYFFETPGAARIRMKAVDFKEERVMTSGVKYPPAMLARAAELNDANPAATVRISIVEVIKGKEELTGTFDIKIKKPISYVYEED